MAQVGGELLLRAARAARDGFDSFYSMDQSKGSLTRAIESFPEDLRHVYSKVKPFVSMADAANLAIAFGGPQVQSVAYPLRRLLNLYESPSSPRRFKYNRTGYLRSSRFTNQRRYRRFRNFYDKQLWTYYPRVRPVLGGELRWRTFR